MARATRRSRTATQSLVQEPQEPPAAPPSLGQAESEAGTDPEDYLSTLSAELHALILDHVGLDYATLRSYCLVSKSLEPHVRAFMYRDLKVITRPSAHALHRTLHGSELIRYVKSCEADIGKCAKTGSTWQGWFLFHSQHSLSGIISSCRFLQHLTLYLPNETAAWTDSLCNSIAELKLLRTFNKDVCRSSATLDGAGKAEGMDVGWQGKEKAVGWSVARFLKTMHSIHSLDTLRLSNFSSDSSTDQPKNPHSSRLKEVVLLEFNITNTDLLALLGVSESVERLTLWRSSLLSKKGLSHVIRKCPNLREFRVGGSWFGAKDDELNASLDGLIPMLPHLHLLHVSGALISPAALLHSCLNLTHLVVANCPAFTPEETHKALANMTGRLDRLTLKDLGSWDERWRFAVQETGKAKGVKVEGLSGSDDLLSEEPR